MINIFYISKLASPILNQITSLMMVLILSPSEYGYLGLVISLSQLFYVASCGWTNGVLLNIGSKRQADTGAYADIVFYRFIIVVPIVLFFILAAFFGEDLINDFYKINGSYTLVIYLFLGYVFYDFGSQILYPGNMNRTQSLLEFFASAILLGTAIFSISSVIEYVHAYLYISICLFSIIILIFTKINYSKKIKFKKQHFDFVLKYSLWQIIGLTGIYIMNYGANYVMVICNIGYEQMGLYSFAYRIFMGMSPFFALFGILIPKWIHNNEPNFKFNIDRNIFVVIVFLVSIYLLIAFSLDVFLKVIGRPEYQASRDYLFLLVPAFLFMCYSNIMNTIFANTIFFKRVQYGMLIQGVVFVLTVYPLVYYFSVHGTIYATNLSFAASFIYINILYNKFKRQIFDIAIL